MDSRHDRMRVNVDGDRLSNLPDDLLHKILSFISIKHAIETSVLSSRWRFLWTSLPYLNFSSGDFFTLPKFAEFATHVLSRRDNKMELFSVKLSFRGKVGQVFFRKILKYAFSHNVQQLTVTCLALDKENSSNEFPLSLFSSQPLKHLTLNGSSYSCSINFKSTWELPQLTTLYLDYVTFLDDSTDKCIDLFSKCVNLKNLTLSHCKMLGYKNGFSMCHPGLLNLTLDYGDCDVKLVDVVAPQLKNLIVRACSGGALMISAPELAYFLYKVKGYHLLQISADSFRFLEKVDLYIRGRCKADAHIIVGLLQQLHSVKFLSLNLQIIELLSSSVELISHQPSPFANLKTIVIYPELLWGQAYKEVTISPDVKKFFLDSSPSATFTVVSHEATRDLKNKKLIQELMAELRVTLDQEKAKTNRANMERPMESHMHEQGNENKSTSPEMDRKVRNRNKRCEVMRCWDDLTLQNVQGKTKTWDITSKLEEIDELMMKLPASKRDEMQPCFSSLCAETEVVMNKMIDCLKIQCDTKRIRVRSYFHQLATEPQPSS